MVVCSCVDRANDVDAGDNSKWRVHVGYSTKYEIGGDSTSGVEHVYDGANDDVLYDVRQFV